MARVITAFNWAAGTIFLLLAVGWPMLQDSVTLEQEKTRMQGMVKDIVRLQAEHYQGSTPKEYLFFPPDRMPPHFQSALGIDATKPQDVIFDTYLSEDKQSIVVRARVSDAAIRAMTLPPLVYLYQQDLESGRVTQGWQPLSGRKPGLF